MKKHILITIFVLIFSTNIFAHESFKLVSSEKKIIKSAELVELEKGVTVGKIEKETLTFTEKEIRLIIKTGPLDDMLSYRIQGVRNPILGVPSGATLKILFVNADEDMRHDVRFGHIEGDFDVTVKIDATAGSNILTSKSADETMQAEEIVLQATSDGEYKYFCSVRGHAKGGMWGNIFVGVEPDKNVKTAEKKEHNHSEHEHEEDEPTDKKEDEMPEMDHSKHKKEMSEKDMSNMDHSQHDDEMPMPSTVDINAPMSKEGSGTSWLPESSPMYGYMKMFKDGSSLMFHGNMFVRYTSVGSSRDLSIDGKGDRQRFDAPSMFMAMYRKPLTKNSQFGFRVMMSLDPIIEKGYGYPLLYQSGETFNGQPLHDRQHPHDLFDELAVTYSYKFNDKNSFYLYAGFPGEPALGPPVFMHRLSGMDNPDAPISHHWQDSSHITWGVVTAGFNFGKFKIEGSAFKGEEPDENRYNFDSPKLDSFSARFSFNPNKNWAFQVSHGILKNPEPSEPEIETLRRTTASAIYNKRYDDDRNWANTFVWGMNDTFEGKTNALLFESNYKFQKNSIFGRFETVQKSGHELNLDEEDEQDIYRVNLLSVGYVRDIFRHKGIDVGIGGQLTYYNNPSSLNSYYGGQNHGGWQIFMRFRPSLMKHH